MPIEFCGLSSSWRYKPQCARIRIAESVDRVMVIAVRDLALDIRHAIHAIRAVVQLHPARRIIAGWRDVPRGNYDRAARDRVTCQIP